MTTPIKNTKHVEEAQANLLTQFRNKLVINGLVKAHAVQLQEIENMFMDLLIKRLLENAEGAQLDVWGRIVGELRGGRDDTDYRAAINTRSRINRIHSRIEDLILVLQLIADREYDIVERGNSVLHIRIRGALTGTDPTPVEINARLQDAKGATIRLVFIYSLYDDDHTFRWADGDTRQTDSDQGWADTAKTIGGYWADVV